MERFKEHFWFSLALALLCGLIAGGALKFYFGFPTADWAAKGVPLWERLSQEWSWWLQGFIPGAIVGFVIGPIVYRLVPSDEWIEADPTGDRARRVERWSQVLAWLIGAGMLVFGILVVAGVL